MRRVCEHPREESAQTLLLFEVLGSKLRFTFGLLRCQAVTGLRKTAQCVALTFGEHRTVISQASPLRPNFAFSSVLAASRFLKGSSHYIPHACFRVFDTLT